MKDFILVLDAGTSSVKAFIIQRDFSIAARCDMDIEFFSPSLNAVEQDADEIYTKSVRVCSKAMQSAGIDATDVECIAITAQRGSGIFWDRKTGEPLRKMISWMDSRTLPISEGIEKDGWVPKLENRVMVSNGTLQLKLLSWELRNNPLINEKYRQGDLMFGGVDTWLIYKLTKGKSY